MASVKVDFKTLMMKLVNIFPKDMYLIHNWCAIAGEESDVENRGSYFCILEPNVREMLNKTFPNNPVIYIKSVRETKTDLTKVTEILDEKILNKLNETTESFMKSVKNDYGWDEFNFSESEISDLFDDGKSITIFEDRDDIPSMIISKSIFPMITGKTINKVRYMYNKYEDNEELNQIIMIYDYDLFQFVMSYHYLKI